MRRVEPAVIFGADRFTDIAAGQSHTCGVSTRASVHCWGDNRYGQSGQPLWASTVPVPSSVALPGPAADVASDDAHSCALLDDGAASCWGDNQAGQLGNGTTSISATPVNVSATAPFVAITAGASSTCALTKFGEAYCWGANDHGQLGDGTRQSRSRPVRSALGNRFQRMSISSHACGVTLNDQLLCWGDNRTGALGAEVFLRSLSPVSPSRIGRVKGIATGAGHTCAIDIGDAIYCWGAKLFRAGWRWDHGHSLVTCACFVRRLICANCYRVGPCMRGECTRQCAVLGRERRRPARQWSWGATVGS